MATCRAPGQCSFQRTLLSWPAAVVSKGGRRDSGCAWCVWARLGVAKLFWRLTWHMWKGTSSFWCLNHVHRVLPRAPATVGWCRCQGQRTRLLRRLRTCGATRQPEQLQQCQHVQQQHREQQSRERGKPWPEALGREGARKRAPGACSWLKLISIDTQALLHLYLCVRYVACVCVCVVCSLLICTATSSTLRVKTQHSVKLITLIRKDAFH